MNPGPRVLSVQIKPDQSDDTAIAKALLEEIAFG